MDAVAGSPTQSTINIAGATNSNTTIFWITAKDDVAKTVTVSVAPTGVTTNAWKIGGRFYLGGTGSPTNARIEAALRAGDRFIFNDSPNAQAATIWTFQNAGTVSGYCKIIGKTGVLPKFNTTNTSVCISSSQAHSWVENLEADQDGASGDVISLSTGGVVLNVKVSDGGGVGVAANGAGSRVIGCDISGVSGDGVRTQLNNQIILGNYIHDVGGDGIEDTSTSNPHGTVILFNVIDTCTGRGILISGSVSFGGHNHCIFGNTVYNCGNSGIEATDAQGDPGGVLMNNILVNNGNAAGESNIEWVGGAIERTSIHGYNVAYNNSGADAPINFTVNGSIPNSEFTTDPLLVDPANGDFRIGVGSPAQAAGFPGTLFGVAAAGIGYLDMGAIQRRLPPVLAVNSGVLVQ